MRKKSITVFLCVYAALCISYCAASSAIVPDNDDLIAVTESIQTEEASSEKSSLSSKKETSSESSNTESSDISSGNNITVPDAEKRGESNTALPEPEENNEVTIQDNIETEDCIEPPEEIIQQYDDGQQYEEIEEESEDEIVEEKPTLEEFLRGLRCSGCRHNCTLLSPRCMNGAKKASQAESQYYNIL